MSNKLEIQSLQEQAQLLIQLISRIRESHTLSTDPTEQLKYEKQLVDNDAKLAFVKDKLQALLATEKQSIPSPTSIKFQTHHQHTCDRTDQVQAFIQYVYEQADPAKKIHFFHLHGGDLQEHAGLYRRFVHKLRGEDLDYKENYEASKIQVIDCGSIDFPNYTQEAALKIGVGRELMKTIGIEDHQMEKVMDKNLHFVLQESPKLQQLSPHDKICFFVSIIETRWDATTTPNITKWFIHQFCTPKPPATAPDFYFFFSIEYDEDNEQVQQQVNDSLAAMQTGIALEELKMVQKSDVQDWFNIYDVFWERKSQQKKTFKKYFAAEDEELYMDDVQFNLKKVINEINNAEKDANRHS